MRGMIKNGADIEQMFCSGTRIGTKAVQLIISKTPVQRGQHGRVAFIAGKKLGNAPQRSRAKRIMREVCHAIGGAPAGFDVIFLAKRPLFNLPQQTICDECARALDSLRNRKLA